MNYAKAIPRDTGGAPMQTFPSPRVALATTALSTGVSSLFSLNPNTTTIEVAAPTVGVAIKWIGVGAAQTSVITSIQSTANFDHVIPAATVRQFVVPKETQGKPLGLAGSQAGSIYGLYQRVAVVPVTLAIASILVTEF